MYTFSQRTAGNCVRLLVGGMRTITFHATDQSPRITPSCSLGKGTPDLFGHRWENYGAETEVSVGHASWSSLRL